MLKSILAPRYPIILYLAVVTDLHTDGIIVCRKSSEGEPSKHTDRTLAIPWAYSPTATASTPPPAGGTSSTIRSTIEAKDSVLRIVDFLEGMKDAEADREGTLSSFTASSLWFLS
jgi:hypothetical protein